MTLRLRNAFLIGLIVVIIGFLYVEREIISPFILAAIFAYIFNPVVNFISRHIKVPRTISILTIYILIILLFVYLGVFLVGQTVKESSQLKSFIESIVTATKDQYNVLPDFAKPIATDILESFEKFNVISPSIFRIFPQALSRVFSFLDMNAVTGFLFCLFATTTMKSMSLSPLTHSPRAAEPRRTILTIEFLYMLFFTSFASSLEKFFIIRCMSVIY